MSSDILTAALNDPLRKKHHLNVLFGDIDKNPNVQGYNQWCDPEKHQTEDDIKKLFGHHKENYRNYGFATGHEGLADIDFDWLWVYFRAKEHFEERLNTYTIKTPNGGIRVLLFMDSIKNPEKFKESLKVEIHFKKYVVCYGEAKKDDGSIGTYETLKDTAIVQDKALANDFMAFLSELLEKYKFLTYPCIKSKLPHKKNHLTHEQRLAISNFLVHAGIPIPEAAEFFSMCPDYDKAYSENQVSDTAQRIKEEKLNYPTCEKLREDFSWDEKDCKNCLRKKEKADRAGNKKGSKSDDEAKPIPISALVLEDVLYEQVKTIDGFQFACLKNGSVEYVKDIRNSILGITYIPLVNDAITTGAVRLPSDVKDFGTPQELTEAIQCHIHSYLDVNKDMEVFATWYILLSWVFDRVNTLPYLRAMGDTGCGKSRFLDVIGGLCYKPCSVSGAITPAPIYRMIKQWGGTIVLDEADFRDSSEKSEVITILNCGFEKNRPVIRCDQNNVDNLQFLPTYCPKVIATRYTFDDKALESRCLTEKMTQTDRKDIPRVLPIKFYEEQQTLRNKLLMFRFKHYYLINGDSGQGIDFGEGIEPRLQQATMSFAALFSKIPELMERFKAFIGQYNRELIEERSESFDGMMVRALIGLHEEGTQDISGKMIADKMIADFGLEKVTPQAVGKHLKSLKVETERKGHSNLRTVKWDEAHIQKLKTRYVLTEKRQVISSPITIGALDTNGTDNDLRTKSLDTSSVPSAPSIIGESTNLALTLNQDAKLSQADLIQHIREELILQAKQFPEGTNEYLIANQAYRWQGVTEEQIINTISHLIERGDIVIVSTDPEGIRRVKWVG
jgi:hypothetical protein